MGDFRKKYPSDWLSGKTNSCKEIPEGKNPTLTKISFKACKAGKKCYTSAFQEKKFYHQRPNHPYPSQKSNGWPLRS